MLRGRPNLGVSEIAHDWTIAHGPRTGGTPPMAKLKPRKMVQGRPDPVHYLGPPVRTNRGRA